MDKFFQHASIAVVIDAIYRVRQQKPDAQNFNSKETFKKTGLKLNNNLFKNVSKFNFVLVMRQLLLKYE